MLYPEIRVKDKKDIHVFLRTQPYSADTMRNYRLHLEKLHRWLLHQKIEFKDMIGDDFLGYLEEKTTWGAHYKRQALSAAKAYAREKYGNEHSIMSLRVKRPPTKMQRTLTVEEISQVLDSIDLDKILGIRNYATLCLMVDTGLRATEICRLEIQDVDLDKCTLQVQQKGGGYRMAAFTAYTCDFLLDWLTMRESYAKIGVKAVFVAVIGDSAGNPMTRSGLKSNFRHLARRAGVKHFSPHALRRTMATIMVGVNKAPNRIAQISGGWKDGKQVETYTKALGIESTRQFLAMHAVKTSLDNTPRDGEHEGL